MKCLETRQRNGAKWRRYRTGTGEIVFTCEVPINTEGIKALKEEIKKAELAADLKSRLSLARTYIDEGWKPSAIAHETGISENHVRRMRAAKQPEMK